jgi:hypothetical protein
MHSHSLRTDVHGSRTYCRDLLWTNLYLFCRGSNIHTIRNVFFHVFTSEGCKDWQLYSGMDKERQASATMVPRRHGNAYGWCRWCDLERHRHGRCLSSLLSSPTDSACSRNGLHCGLTRVSITTSLSYHRRSTVTHRSRTLWLPALPLILSTRFGGMGWVGSGSRTSDMM